MAPRTSCVLDQPSTSELHPYLLSLHKEDKLQKWKRGLTVHALGNTLPGEELQSTCDIGNFSACLYVHVYMLYVHVYMCTCVSWMLTPGVLVNRPPLYVFIKAQLAETNEFIGFVYGGQVGDHP